MQMSHAFHTIPSTISLHFLLQKDVHITLQQRLKGKKNPGTQNLNPFASFSPTRWLDTQFIYLEKYLKVFDKWFF